MHTASQRHLRTALCGLLLCAALPSAAAAQTVIPQTMTRSKVWIKANPNGSTERENTLGQYDFEVAYPGYFDNRNEMVGGFDGNAIYNGAQVGGEDVAWLYRNNFNTQNIYAIIPSALVKNYNLTNPNAPEESITGTIGSDTTDPGGRRHMAYRLEGRVMGWSQPKYDDFILIRCRLTCTDRDTLKNFYYARYLQPNGPYRPSSVSTGYDTEYLWDPAVSDTLGFIFYDDTSIPPDGPPPVYSIPPGDSTGNAGDPGNIGTQGSRDFKLYSPNLYAFSFVPSHTTPNKFGQRKIWRSIVSTSSNAPAEERMPSWNTDMGNYSTMVGFITGNEQPKVSWRDANRVYQPGDKAGSLWERSARYVYAIGPYDIAPGQTIEWVEIFMVGAMSRDTTIRGGLYSTTRFVSQGLAAMKQNWAAARSLIFNNYRFPTGQVPPPTPADAPKVGNTNELRVKPSERIANGTRTAGAEITWKAVHVGYTDPQTRRADFAAYRIYRSDNSVEGPWEQIASVPKTIADSLVVAGNITYFVSSPVGVPYRYSVTSIDSGGNESGMTGYSYYPIASEPDPSNALTNVVVVPNPFRQVSGYSDQSENKRLQFMNIPAKCTIRIYTLALDLVRTLEHDGAGLQTWGTQTYQDYMLTDFGQNVMPGIYIYHVESHVPGHEGETAVGKFAIIR